MLRQQRTILWLLLALLLGAVGCGGRTITSGDTTNPTPDQLTPQPDTLTPSDTVITPPQDQVTPPQDQVTPPQDQVTPPNDTVTPPKDTQVTGDVTIPLGASGSVFFGPAGFVDAVVNEFNGAKSSIYLTIYEFTQSVFADPLIAAHERGAEVKVIFDVKQTAANTAIFNKLKAAGISVIWSSSYFVYTHSKNAIIDKTRLLVMSHNLIGYSISSERNHGVITTESDLVTDALEVFDADWVNRAPKIANTRLIVSPQNARAKMLALINSAQTSLDFQHMQFSDSQVQAAVVARVNAGVTVRILLASPSWITTNKNVACYLGKDGIEVFYQYEFQNHAKLMIVDGVKAVIGSVNFSSNSLDNNREMSVLLENAASLKELQTLFDYDWSKRAKITYNANVACNAQ